MICHFAVVESSDIAVRACVRVMKRLAKVIWRSYCSCCRTAPTHRWRTRPIRQRVTLPSGSDSWRLSNFCLQTLVRLRSLIIIIIIVIINVIVIVDSLRVKYIFLWNKFLKLFQCFIYFIDGSCTCEIKDWNNFEVLIISAAERVLTLCQNIERAVKYSCAAASLWYNFEIISAKFLPWIHVK